VDFSSYRQQLLVRPEGEIALLDLVRNFSQWFFASCAISSWSGG
jgi:hypothetical protein